MRGVFAQELNNQLYDKDFQKNAYKKMREYFSAIENIEGSVSIKTYKNRELLNEYEVLVIGMYPCVLEQLVDIKSNVETVYGSNPNYTFELKRADKNESWTLDSVVAHVKTVASTVYSDNFPSGTEKSYSELLMNSTFRQYFARGLTLYPNNFLATLISLPEFEIIEIERVQLDGVQYLALTYGFEPSGPNEDEQFAIMEKSGLMSDLPIGLIKYPLIHVRSGKLLLTTDYYLLKEAEVNVAGQGKRKIVYSYDNQINKVPLLTKYHLFDQANNYEEIFSFMFCETKPRDINRFTLVAYGLPEPDFGSHRPGRLRYIIFGIGLLMLVIGAWRMIQKRRENT